MLIILSTLNYTPVVPRVSLHVYKQFIARYTADVLPDHPKKLQFNPCLNRNSCTEKIIGISPMFQVDSVARNRETQMFFCL